MKTAISPSRQPKPEHSANPIDFLDEDLVLVPASGIPEEFRKLSRFLPVIVLVPKSALHDKTTRTSREPVSPSLDSSIPAISAYRWMQRRLG